MLYLQNVILIHSKKCVFYITYMYTNCICVSPLIAFFSLQLLSALDHKLTSMLKTLCIMDPPLSRHSMCVRMDSSHRLPPIPTPISVMKESGRIMDLVLVRTFFFLIFIKSSSGISLVFLTKYIALHDNIYTNIQYGNNIIQYYIH